MAKSIPKRRNLRPFPKTDDVPAADSGTTAAVAEPENETATPFDDMPVKAPAEEPAPKKIPRVATFFERMQGFNRKDWDGGRAKVKLYRLAPLINRLVGSEHKFVTIYGEPVTEERIKVDHGSGRYRLYLNYKAPAGSQEKELDMVEIDILDQNYPPKIPPGEWMDDPRNKSWAWAKPKDAPGTNGSAPAPDPLAHLNTFMDIQDRIEERIKPAQQPPAAPTAVDPWAAAERILNMRAENPMMAILQQQMADNAKALEAERERAFKSEQAAREREFALQKQLLESKNNTPPAKGLIEQIVETVGGDNKVDMLKRLFNNGSAEAGPARRTTGLDLARELGGKLFEGPIAEGLGQWIGSLAQRNVNGNGHAPMNPAQGNAQPAKGSPEHLARFIELTVNPALLSHYVRGMSGSDFAAWLADGGYMDELAQLQNFTHPRIPGQRGAQAIVTAYKNTPHMWPTLSSQGENRFIQFVNEFCAWVPETEDETIDVEHRTVMDEGPEEEDGPERI
jgi:hypothetical protein